MWFASHLNLTPHHAQTYSLTLKGSHPSIKGATPSGLELFITSFRGRRADALNPRLLCLSLSGMESAQGSSEYKSRFGEPVPMLLNRPEVAAPTIALRTVAGDAPGNLCR